MLSAPREFILTITILLSIFKEVRTVLSNKHLSKKESEIYIQKNTKKLIDGPYVKYKGWKVYDFIDKNTKK